MVVAWEPGIYLWPPVVVIWGGYHIQSRSLMAETYISVIGWGEKSVSWSISEVGQVGWLTE